MASRCVNCGGELRFDIALQRVKCIHCDSTFEPESFKIKTAAEEYRDPTSGPKPASREEDYKKDISPLQSKDKQYATTIFVCPNCGAEIFCDSLDAVNYCMYCGSFVTLESQLGRVRRPTQILPFAKTMEDCKAAYRKAVSGKIYAPSEFREEKFIEGFKGMYIPFWHFQYEYGPQITIRGEKEERDGDYVYTHNFNINCEAEGKINNVAYDASSSFDDEISLRIAPFNMENAKAFNPAYMFGFFGDTADIDKKLYQKASDEEIEKQLWQEIIKDKHLKEGYPVESVPDSIEADLQLKKKVSLAMLPIWFLTWRKGNRIAYSIMNGDTGEMYTEIPVSIWRYLIFSVLTAVPIFFILNMLVTLSASTMLGWAMGLAFLMIVLYVFELDKLVLRVTHKNDLGFLSANREAMEKSKDIDSNIVMDVIEGLMEASAAEWFLILIGIVASAFCMTEFFVIGVVVVVFGTPGYTLWRLISNGRLLRDYTVWLDVLPALFSIVFGGAMLIYDPAPDQYYYGSAILCMLGVGVAAIRMVGRYNEVITRPLPRFFSRREGVKG